ncbi:MAG: heme lyase CcmF/NrfE family subunit [Thermodesulfovibrionales bacterium]
MTEFGSFSLLFAFALSVVVLASLLWGLRRKDGRFIEVAYRASEGVFAFMSAAVALLVYAFVQDDFRLEYVVSYSERALPLFYKLTGLWAGQQGSLLFWGWLISLYTFITLRRNEGKPGSLYLPYVLVFLDLTALFFLLLVNFVTPPFELAARIPSDGNGLNPLLQNPGMVFHPPTLYLGYVGFSVSFSFAMAALVMGELGDWWIKKTRAWTLYSWLFLTLGIVFGGWWAYRELGWGGVWGWDPVENSSLMPWFTASAFLHSVMIQERRGMLKVWNLVLIILTYALSIFGAFVTRSGIINSVHSFGQSGVGYVFLAFLFLIGGVSFYLVATRYGKLKEKNPRLESLVSKESSFLYNNIILLGLCFATFWGTVFPLVSEAVKGVKISVGPPFFNTVNSPLFLLLLGLMAVCPLLGWRRTSTRGAVRNLALPGGLMALSLPALYAAGVKGFMPMFFFAFSLFVVVSIAREFHMGTRAEMRKGRGPAGAFLALVTRNRRRYGGFLVHVGIVFMALGLAGYGYFQYKEDYNLKPGQEIEVRDYRLRYLGLQGSKKGTYEAVGAVVEVYGPSGFMGTLRPEKRYYRKAEPTTEVAIMNNPSEDLYLILGGWTQDMSATVTVVVNPLLSWAWVGTGVVIFGTVWAVLPRRRRSEEEVDVAVADVLVRLRRSASA